MTPSEQSSHTPSGARPKAGEYTIRQLADEFDVTSRTLRFYESRGLLRPRRQGQARLYSAADRARLILVLRGKRIGFSLEEIKELLDVKSLGTSDACASVARRFRERIAALRRQRDDIDAAIRDLEDGSVWLEAKAAGNEPSEEAKRRAAAFETLARSWLYGGEAPTPAE